MEIKHRNDTASGAFYMEQGTDTVAELVYSIAGKGQLVLEHTEVDDAFRGQKIGNKLVDRAVCWARQEGKKIVPACVFAKAVFDRMPEYGDVLFVDGETTEF